jgi:hypothetical protein
MRPTLRNLVPVLLLPILTATAPGGSPTLRVEPAEVHVDAVVTIIGEGFGACVERPYDVDSEGRTVNPVGLTSDPALINVTKVDLTVKYPGRPVVDATFKHTVTVPRDAPSATYEITASCSPSGGEITAATSLTVLDALPGVDSGPVDPRPGTDVPPLDDQVLPWPDVGLPTPVADPGGAATAVAAVAAAALVALLALLLGRSALRRHAATKASTTVHVRAVTGVVVGPTAQRPAAEGEGVRVVPHADPGYRVLRVG